MYDFSFIKRGLCLLGASLFILFATPAHSAPQTPESAPAAVAPAPPAAPDPQQDRWSVQLGGPGIELRELASQRVLASVAVPEGARALVVRGSLIYVARNTRGVLIVDASDARAPRPVGSFADHLAVRQLLVSTYGLMLYTEQGEILFGLLSDPLHPVLASVQQEDERPVVTRWDGLQRFYFKALPFYVPFGAGGLAMKLGYELNTRRGFHFGVAFDPITFYYPAIGSFLFRAEVGYGGRRFGASVGIATGYPLFYPVVSPAFRIGSYQKAHVNLRIAWTVFLPYPISAEIEAVIPVSKRYRLTLEASCGNEVPLSQCLSGHALVGMQYFLSGEGLRQTSIFSFGAGVTFQAFNPFPGPALSFGYERRF